MILLCTLIGLTGVASFVAGNMTSDPEVQIFFRSLVGASIGAFIGLSLWPGKSLRQNAGLIAVNLCLGSILGPTLYLHATQKDWLTPGFIHMVMCGGGTSAFGMAVLRIILPYFPRLIEVAILWLCPAPLKAAFERKRAERRVKKQQDTREHLP